MPGGYHHAHWNNSRLRPVQLRPADLFHKWSEDTRGALAKLCGLVQLFSHHLHHALRKIEHRALPQLDIAHGEKSGNNSRRCKVNVTGDGGPGFAPHTTPVLDIYREKKTEGPTVDECTRSASPGNATPRVITYLHKQLPPLSSSTTCGTTELAHVDTLRHLLNVVNAYRAESFVRMLTAAPIMLLEVSAIFVVTWSQTRLLRRV